MCMRDRGRMATAQSREAGCDGHLVEPVNPTDLDKLLGELRPHRGDGVGGPEETIMPDEDKKQEIDDKVTALVTTRFGGDYRAAFAHYDADGNGVIDKDELKALLKDAGIGSGLT